ncbi:MAG: hypothetical protein EZS28_026493, partial [Streblomastix strix]
SLDCIRELKELIIHAGVDDEFGGNTIRHSMMTKLRQEEASLEQVNEFTRHAPGSSVVDRFYNKPEKAEDLGSCAGIDGDWFGTNPLVGFETEPEPINHSTVFLMKLRVSNSHQIQVGRSELLRVGEQLLFNIYITTTLKQEHHVRIYVVVFVFLRIWPITYVYPIKTVLRLIRSGSVSHPCAISKQRGEARVSYEDNYKLFN